jgi:hypothetical protein
MGRNALHVPFDGKLKLEFQGAEITSNAGLRPVRELDEDFRLTCRNFRDNQARLQLLALAYNLGNFLRRPALPSSVKHRSSTKLREIIVPQAARAELTPRSGQMGGFTAESAIPVGTERPQAVE